MKKIFLMAWQLVTVCLGCLAADIPTGLPVVYITTPDGTAVRGRDWRQGVELTICQADGVVSFVTSTAQVKAHGNSSFNKPKKPMTLKFDHPVSFLGMTANTKWFLVSNFMDHSLLRNSLALTVARSTTMVWNSDWRLVNVVENGRYVGCYLVGEEIHVGPSWVDTDLDTGFLVELDEYPNDGNRFETSHRHLPVNVRYPLSPTTAQMTAIQQLLNGVEDILYGQLVTADLSSFYARTLNLDSFVDYYIVYELCQNAEPNGPRSCYMFLGKDGRLNAGPVWDFDLAFENMDLDEGGDLRPERFHMSGVHHLTVDSLYDSRALWYDRLLSDSTFRYRLSQRWTALRSTLVGLADSLDAWKRIIIPSAQADQLLWGSQDPARFDDTGSFEASFKHLRETYLRRIEVLDGLFVRH